MRDATHGSPLAAQPFQQKFLPAPERAHPDRPIKGTWFRSELDLRVPEGSELTTAIIERIAGIEIRSKALRPRDALNRFRLVRSILANALACYHHRVLPYVAYRRTSAFYWAEPEWLNGNSIAHSIDLLVECGLVHSWIGRKRRASSTYAPTRGLLELALEYEVGRASIVANLPRERLVRLRESNSDGPELSFAGDKATEGWSDQLEAYNHFVAQHDLSVSVSKPEVREWLVKLNKQKAFSGLSLRMPELFRSSLYRTFNNGSFDYGGRLYGAWWTNAPRSIRSSIKINGSDTVEYDYSGCAIRMLYHEGKIDYQEDPYRIEPLWEFARQKALPEDHFREPVKALTQALINGRSDGFPERARIDNFTFKPFSRGEIREMIEEKHSAIADNLATGAGLRLQRKEADLALSIIMELMDQGILALPVHDSFLVDQQFEKELNKRMDSCYLNLFGFHPCIKKEG